MWPFEDDQASGETRVSKQGSGRAGGEVNDMDKLTYKDPETGLYDNNFFIAQLNPALEQMVENKRWGALLLVELLNIDDVADTYGDSAADKVVARMAEALRYSVRISDLVARYDANRFVILLKDGMQPTAAINLAKRQLRKLLTPMRIGGNEIGVEIAVGIRVIAPRAKSADQLLKQVEQALNHAKDLNGSGYSVYQNEEDRAFDIGATQPNGLLHS